MQNYYISMTMYYQDLDRPKALQIFTSGPQLKVDPQLKLGGKTNHSNVQQNRARFLEKA